MSSRKLVVAHLAADNRLQVETRLDAFEASWSAEAFDRQFPDLPAEYSLRWPLLLGLVGSDLREQWRRGRKVFIDSYLERFPEIGTPDTVPVSLLYAEYLARYHHGDAPAWEEYQDRYPHHVEELRRLVEAHLAETAPQDVMGTLPMSAPAPPPPAPPPVPPEFAEEPTDEPAEDHAPPAVGGTSWRMPDRLGRYRILQQLGQGGMGSVYLAHDTQLDREVALKVPRFAADENEENLVRFFREARAAAKIEHPNICPLYDVGEIDGIRYLTMAHVKGKPLSAILQPGKPINVANAVSVVRKLALGIAAAHAKGIVHRDLKPSNIIINKHSEPIVLDFGMAREVTSDQSRLTQYGNLVGTPAYMSPEQVRGELNALGPNCDIYALGVILYQFLTGHLPFEGETFTVLAKLLTEEPTPPQEHRPHLDEVICQICLKAMARDPRDRFQSMQEFAHALAGYMRRLAGEQMEKSPRQREADRYGSGEQPQGPHDLAQFEPAAYDPVFGLPPNRSYGATAGAAFPAPPLTPARQTMPAAMTAPPIGMPPAYAAPYTPDDPDDAAGLETAPTSGGFTPLVWVLGASALLLLLTLVVVLVVFSTQDDKTAGKTKPAPTPVRAAANAPTRPAEWKAFLPPGSNCGVYMPGAPERDPQRNNLYVAADGPIRYSLSWADQPTTPPNAAQMAEALRKERERILQIIPTGELRNESKLTLDGHDGMAWEMVSSTQQTKYLIRCYIVRQRQYLLYVTCPLNAEQQMEPRRFFESFHLK